MNITTPLTDDVIAKLHAGDKVRITGVIYVGRDAAHKRMVEAMNKGEPLPFDPRGQIIYYMGPSPAPPGRPIGAAGPTTASRMDRYTETILALGVRGLIGKGRRGSATKEIIRNNRVVYFATFGGAAAYLAMRITASEIIAFPDLGPEA